MPELLELAGVGKSYDARVVLSDVTLSLDGGQILAVVGENGAGKSTLVKVLAGLNHPYEGEVRVNGAVVNLTSSLRASHAGIAVLAQELSVLPNLSVAENVLLGNVEAPTWWGRRRLNKLAKPHLQRVGLGHVDPSVAAGKLMVAEQQLVELARTLARRASVVILDEPTAALDDLGIQRVKDAARSLAAAGCLVIYVSHRIEEILELADHVMVVRNGQTSKLHTAAGLAPADLISMMIGRPLAELYPAPRPYDDLSELLTVAEATGPGLTSPLSLTVGRGEVVGLAGQTGSGHSATLALIAGQERVASGRVELEGKSVLGWSGRRTRRALRYVSPERKMDGIFPGRTVKENLTPGSLSLVALAGVVSSSRESALAGRLADKVALDRSRMGSDVVHLSGGNQQKVVIGRWVGERTRVLLVEEPTRGVDIGARAEIYAALRGLAEAGTAIVVASSDVHELLGIADRVVTFYRGRVVHDHVAASTSAEQVLREITHSAPGATGSAEGQPPAQAVVNTPGVLRD